MEREVIDELYEADEATEEAVDVDFDSVDSVAEKAEAESSDGLSEETSAEKTEETVEEVKEEVIEEPNMVRTDELFKFVLPMRKRMQEEGYDYIDKCINWILSGEMSNCVMVSDIENNTMDVPAWYFGLNPETLELDPIDVQKYEKVYQDFAFVIIASGENTLVSGNWRDKISLVGIDKKSLFKNVKNALGYDPIFTSIKYLCSERNNYLNLFYTREVPIMFDMEAWNNSKKVFTDANGIIHIQLNDAEGIVVKFKDLVDHPEDFKDYISAKEFENTNDDAIRYKLPESVTADNPVFKYSRLPGAILKKDRSGKLFPVVVYPTITEGKNMAYEERPDMEDFVILLLT